MINTTIIKKRPNPIITVVPYPKINAPAMLSKINDKKSVILSANTIGALLLIGVPFCSLSRYDLKTSPIFPGVTDIINEERKIKKLIFLSI
jgi:hypothetical protein